MNIERIRAGWWSLLRDFVFPLVGLYGLYNLFAGHFSELAVPIVGGLCMALLGIPFWDRDDRRRRQKDGDEDEDPPSRSFTIRIGR